MVFQERKGCYTIFARSTPGQEVSVAVPRNVVDACSHGSSSGKKMDNREIKPAFLLVRYVSRCVVR